MSDQFDYPAKVDAQLDSGLSRWLWLVKWFLVIPHVIVLVFLWIAFMFTSIVAFFSILFTKHYPKGIFDFNVGVIRWSWRVSYYSYSALATDKYPPFTLKDVPDYPTHFDVEYPTELSRGLVLVKWWLLAIPQYIVIGVLAGGIHFPLLAGMGLVGVLTLVAGVTLAFTGSYPDSLFELVMGFNRWVLRVTAYASLMTDAYPPFRLDSGGAEPHGTRPVFGTPEAQGGTT